jgi:hypothetical protein
MAEPTLRPWRHAIFMAYGPKNEHIFHCGLGLRGPAFSEEQEANAVLIVRAVNLHDELLALLREAYESREGWDHPWMDRVRAALAKADSMESTEKPE